MKARNRILLNMPHEIKRSLGENLLRFIPFGLGRTKPKHFRDMLRVVWLNRDNLGYAWKVITRGVCDGCALGVAGLHSAPDRPWQLAGPG